MKWLSKDKVIYLWSKIVALHKKSVTDVSISGKKVTITKGDGTKSTQTTQDTTYNVVSKSAEGLAPKLPNETSTTKYLRQDGTWEVPPNDNTTYEDMKGATTGAEGTHGLAPAPAAGAANRYLRSDGTWAVPPNDNTTYEDATQSQRGLMSPDDKKKLDELPTGETIESKYADKESYLTKASAMNTYVSKTSLNTTLTSYAKKSDITGVYRPKGSVADVSKLPTTGNELGDVWSIEADSVYGPAGMNVVWTSEGEWDNLGGIMTLEEITNEELDEICV